MIEVQNFNGALQNIATTTLRAVVGDILLDDVLSKREQINEVLRVKLDEVTERWGGKVTTVEIREITPPRDVQDAMNRQLSAERTRRAVITESEGGRQSAINVAEGTKQAEILRAEGDRQAAILRAEGFSLALERIFQAASQIDQKTMALQYLEALKAIGQGASTKYIFPLEFTQVADVVPGLSRGLEPAVAGAAPLPSEAPPTPPDAPPPAPRLEGHGRAADPDAVLAGDDRHCDPAGPAHLDALEDLERGRGHGSRRGREGMRRGPRPPLQSRILHDAPTGKGSRARKRTASSRHTSCRVVRSVRSIRALRSSNGYDRRSSRSRVAAARIRCFAPAKPTAAGSRGSSSSERQPSRSRTPASSHGSGSRIHVAIEVRVACVSPSSPARTAIATGPPFVVRTIRPLVGLLAASPLRGRARRLRGRGRPGRRRSQSWRGRRTGPRPAG